MSRENRILLITLIALLFVYGVTRKFVYDPKHALRPLYEDAKDADVISVHSTRDTVLKRSGKKYIFQEPFEDIAAEQEQTTLFLTELAKLYRRKDLGEVAEASLKDFGFTPRSPRITLERGTKKTTFVLGTHSAVSPAWYVYDPDTKHLYLTDQPAVGLFVAVPEAFRDRNLVPCADADILSAEVKKANGRSFSLKKEGDDWYVTENGREYLADKSRTAQYLKSLALLLVRDFDPYDNGVTPAQAGLASPRETLSVRASSNVAADVAFGSLYGDNRAYVGVNGKLRGGTDTKHMRDLCDPTTSFVRTDLIDFPLAAVVSFTSKGADMTYTYERDRGKWYRTGKKKRPFEDEKMYAFFMALSGIKAEKFFFDGALGDITKEFVFYDRRDKVLLHAQFGATTDGYVRMQLKGKRGVIEFAPEADKNGSDLWSAPSGDFELMQRLKRLFDPQNLLNRGRLYGRI
jgi:hypothetical protein